MNHQTQENALVQVVPTTRLTDSIRLGWVNGSVGRNIVLGKGVVTFNGPELLKTYMDKSVKILKSYVVYGLRR